MQPRYSSRPTPWRAPCSRRWPPSSSPRPLARWPSPSSWPRCGCGRRGGAPARCARRT
uniref:Uncharacterized protein n=1 Tax=Arundo donax TaxID=35708 RepID=A0A0A8ZYJ7_ARUDO